MTTNVHFSNSPLNEVVIGLQFEGLNWNLNHYGEYFNLIKDKYPELKTANPLLHPSTQPGLKFLNVPEMPRAWYIESAGNFLIQIQNDRFFLNWRKVDGKSDYPNFDFFFKRFQDEWNNFKEFCSKKVSGNINIQYYELTYINHLAKEDDWKTANDLRKYFKHLCFLDDFTNLGLFGLDIGYQQDTFPIKHSIKKAQRSQDNSELFVIDFLIIEKVNGLESTFIERIKKASETLAKEFVRLTTPDAHKAWGKQQ